MPDPSPRYLLPFDTYALPHHLTEVLVVGTGVAGYSAALSAASQGARVLVIAKGDPTSSNTAWAQGGIAAALPESDRDSPRVHQQDTLTVGQGLCDPELVLGIVTDAAAGVRWLQDLGAQFDADPDRKGDIARGLEGGHSVARILHARGDATGAEIRDTLAAAAELEPSIELWGGTYLVDLLTDSEGRCRGALVLQDGKLNAIWAGAVVVASGGYAQVYRETTNVPGATGDGLAVAYRAGAAVQDMEFVQFHPTTLYLAGVPRLLITEAIRGEGAHVVDDQGERFLLLEDPRGELAARDVISRAIVRHLENPGVQGVYLDMRHLDAEHMSRRFPGVVNSCAAHGLDIRTDLVPIRPAAHYSIGGIRTGVDGTTDVAGLFAAGEVTSTGLHGANRLASNSLLEGLVMGRRAGRSAVEYAGRDRVGPIHLAGTGTRAARGPIDVDDLRTSLKALLWREAGIVRTGHQLAGAAGAVRGWESFAHRLGPGSPARLSLINMLCVARLLTSAALAREESRGTHHRSDFPARDEEHWSVHIVHRRAEDETEIVPLSDVASARPEGSTP